MYLPPNKPTGESFTLNGNWNVQSKQLKKNFSQLTDSDLIFVPGKEEELILRLGIKLRKKRDEVIVLLKKGQQ